MLRRHWGRNMGRHEMGMDVLFSYLFFAGASGTSAAGPDTRMLFDLRRAIGAW
jgi:hypothetical protein